MTMSIRNIPGSKQNINNEMMSKSQDQNDVNNRVNSHAPSSNVAELVDEKFMNSPIDEYGNYQEFDKDKCEVEDLEDEELPVLGPYKYENNETYLGQFKDGMRVGWGILLCVVDFGL